MGLTEVVTISSILYKSLSLVITEPETDPWFTPPVISLTVLAVVSADRDVKCGEICRASLHLTTFSHAFDLSQRRRDRNVGPIWKRADMFRILRKDLCCFLISRN